MTRSEFIAATIGAELERAAEFSNDVWLHKAFLTSLEVLGDIIQAVDIGWENVGPMAILDGDARVVQRYAIVDPSVASEGESYEPDGALPATRFTHRLIVTVWLETGNKKSGFYRLFGGTPIPF